MQEHCGGSQQIEWALVNGRPILLQARPVLGPPAAAVWSPPVPGGWFRSYRLGEWLGQPVSPLFDTWLADAFAAKERGELPEPTAMVLSTSLGDRPTSRTVLLKGVEDGTFVFFTNYDSAKGHQLLVNPYAALHLG